MENLLKAIKILKDFNVDYSPVSLLRQAAKILWDNDIKPTDILMAIDLIEEEDEDSDDQAEEHIDQAIQDLEKLYRYKIKQMGGFPKLK